MRRTLLLVAVATLSGAVGGLMAGWAATSAHHPGSYYFTDCSPTSLHDQEIGFMVEAGVVRGVGEGLYQPQGPVTREQMCTYLARATTETWAATIVSVDRNFFAGYYTGYPAYTAGRITWDQYQVFENWLAWANEFVLWEAAQNIGQSSLASAVQESLASGPEAKELGPPGQ
jgi:hypothetical protein